MQCIAVQMLIRHRPGAWQTWDSVRQVLALSLHHVAHGQHIVAHSRSSWTSNVGGGICGSSKSEQITPAVLQMSWFRLVTLAALLELRICEVSRAEKGQSHVLIVPGCASMRDPCSWGLVSSATPHFQNNAQKL